ncbi:hypothetical protein FOA52_013622 [Chlamydomonas sp. UWO 241]|nr:hypothetical protein FOA52_013622 [Chlamydomonas sp. UWO 241]
MHVLLQGAGCGRWAGGALTFSDAVHGEYSLPGQCAAFIDTPQFQRLRGLKQLGLSHFVFPGAEHSRFPHSLGTAHLAHVVAETLRLRQPELVVEGVDVAAVTLAGLCHDLGHGPFSHTWEQELLPRLGVVGWEHEDMSCKVLDAIVDKLPEWAAPSEGDVRRMKAMIDPKARPGGGRGGDAYLFDIVSNKTNGIDVDKFDYLARDSYQCGVQLSFDFRRTMGSFKVLGSDLCFERSHYQQLHELFHSRELMHREVYTHRRVKACNLMLADALHAAEPVLCLRDRLWSAEEFCALDDSLMQRVEYPDPQVLRCLDDVQERALVEAQTILKALRRREIYTFINEILVPHAEVGALSEGEKWKAPSPEHIISYYSGSDVRLRVEDVVLSVNQINYASGGMNPLDSVKFYDTWADTSGRAVPKHQACHMMTDVFQEYSLRLYSRNRDPQVCAALEEAFRAWAAQRFGGSEPAACLSTPVKQRGARGGGGDLSTSFQPSLGGGGMLGRRAAAAGLVGGGGDGALPLGAGAGGGRGRAAASAAAAAVADDDRRGNGLSKWAHQYVDMIIDENDEAHATTIARAVLLTPDLMSLQLFQ